MKKIFLLCLLFSSIALYADKYAGEIFTIGAGIRNFALGSTGLTDVQTPALAYWNSSLLGIVNQSQIEISHSENFEGEVKYDMLSYVSTGERKFAVNVTRIGIDDNKLTRLPHPDEEISETNRPYVYKTVNNADYIAYFGFAQKIRQKFWLGITPKVAYRLLAEKTAWGVGADLSAHYGSADNLLWAIKVHDVFTTKVFWENGTQETVNPGIDTELSYKFNLPLLHKPMRVALGVNGYSEGREEASDMHLGAFSFDTHAGAEIALLDNLSVLTGLNRGNFTGGLTLVISRFYLVYAFEKNADLDNSHRAGAGYRF